MSESKTAASDYYLVCVQPGLYQPLSFRQTYSVESTSK